MRLTGFRFTGSLLTHAALALSLFVGAAQAQQGGANGDNLYRAEIVLLERLVEPEAVEERMASRMPEPTPELERKLWVVGQDGTPQTTMDLVPREKMTLATAADRLERSGRYRVLMTAAWRQAYPPDFKGEPMQIAVGDWLEAAGEREIQGTLTIERMRFLHVTADLHHWQPAPAPSVVREPAGTLNTPGAQPRRPSADDATIATAGEPGLDPTAPLSPEALQPLELLTWIHETRRMRSEEIHFLDSPTIGLLVYFKPIEGGGSQADQPSAQALP